MTKKEIAAIANDETGIYTPEQKAKAEAALVDLQKPNTAEDSYPMLVAMRRQLLERLLKEDTPKSKQMLVDWGHNWPTYAQDGKVLGE
jgi:hypothetical protein